MSGDEIFAFVACLLVALLTWGGWAWVSVAHRSLRGFSPVLMAPLLAVPLSGLLLFGVLIRFASHDVRDDGLYIAFYFVMGAAGTGLAVALLDRLGLSLRDDVVERRNPAACLACAGAFPGLTLAFAGGNIGDGPGWWVVVFSSGLSVGTVLAGWLLVDRIAQVGEAIVVDRDVAKGLRMGGWFLAMGAITGRAAAGNWVSAEATSMDFLRVATGAFALIPLAAVGEGLLRSRPAEDKQAVADGALGAATWIAVATGYLVWVGHW